MIDKSPNGRQSFPFRLFKWFCNPDFHLDIEGDLIELYKRRIEKEGQKKAKFLLYKDILLLFRPGIIRPLSSIKINRHNLMLKHHFILAIRTFKRYRTTFFINILGLSTALLCALLIFLWVMDEWRTKPF